jgi:Family of unknown function (DUF6263)
MKKNFFLIATLLALSLPWVGCSKSGKLDTASTFKPPSGPVELKLKWPQGERIVQVMDMKQNMELSIPGQPAPMKQDMTMGQEYGLTVLKETPDGGHEVEMEFLSARMGMTMGGKTMMDYDSAKKKSGEKANPLADIFGKIVGSKILFFLNATNAVERIEGVDELVNRLSSGGQGDALAPLKSMYSEGYFKQMMSANRFMPPNAVQPGDTWPVQFEFPMGVMGVMVLDYTFTLQSWEKHGKRTCARLEFQGTMSTKPDPNAKSPAMSISILDGNSSGVSWFDPELGITIDTKMNQDMKMVITMSANPRGNPGAGGRMQTITNQMNQVMTIKLVSVK